MCLKKKGTFRPCKVGFKAIKLRDGELHSEFNRDGKPLPVGCWLDEKDFRPSFASNRGTVKLMTSSSRSKYPIGWHILHSPEDVLEWGTEGGLEVVRVQVKEPLCVGHQDGCLTLLNRRPMSKENLRVTIARYIKITGIVK